MSLLSITVRAEGLSGGRLAGSACAPRESRQEPASRWVGRRTRGWATSTESFDHNPPAASGIGLQLVDRTHNTPKRAAFEPPRNDMAIYDKAWKRTAKETGSPTADAIRRVAPKGRCGFA